jgi:hypothetical protein
MRYRLRTLMIVLAVLSVYLASYRALTLESISMEVGGGELFSAARMQRYRFNDPVARAVFWPLAWIDRKIRPGYWGELTEFQGRKIYKPLEGEANLQKQSSDEK